MLLQEASHSNMHIPRTSHKSMYHTHDIWTYIWKYCMWYVAGAKCQIRKDFPNNSCANICAIHTFPMPGNSYQDLSITCLVTHCSATYINNPVCQLYVHTYGGS